MPHHDTPRTRRGPLMTLVVAGAALALAGCSAAGSDDTGSTDGSGTAASAVDPALTAAEVLADNHDVHDLTADPGDATSRITLDQNGSTADGDGSVQVDGSVVTITSAGTYTLSGTLTDGQVVVVAGADDVVHLVLDGVDVTNGSGSALLVQEADQVVVDLADGSQNSLADAEGYSNDGAPTAALASDVDLGITGTGSLTVIGSADDGIASSDGLVVAGGVLDVTAADDGLRGKQYLVVDGGTLTVTAGSDGLKSNDDTDDTAALVHIAGGDLTIDAGQDGVQADTDLVVTGGTVDITAGGGYQTAVAADVSAKGLKGAALVVVEGGSVTVDAADDAVHSNGSVLAHDGDLTLTTGDDGMHADAALVISGGTVTVTDSYEGLEGDDITISGGAIDVTAFDDGINAAGGEQEDDQGDWQGEGSGTSALTITGGTVVVDAGGDGIDVNGTATMSGGTVVVHGPSSGANGALDYEQSFQVTGGTLVALGTSGMAQAPSTDDSADGQGWVFATLSQAVTAGSTVQVADADGTVVASVVTRKDVTSVLVSDPQIESGAEYQVLTGGTVGSGETVGGWTSGGDATGATVLATATAGEAAGGAGGMGGGPAGDQGGGGRAGNPGGQPTTQDQ